MLNPMVVLWLVVVLLLIFVGILIAWFLVTLRRLTGSSQDYFYTNSKTIEETLPNGQKVTTFEKRQHGRMWRDLRKLLLIPLVLTLLTIGYTFAQNMHSEQLARDQQQQTTLENYVNQMSDLLLSTTIGLKLHDSLKDTDQIRRVARVRTLIALNGLDPERKQSVVLFLYQADLITWHRWPDAPKSQLPLVDLTYADLTNADLSMLFLTNADLQWVFLKNANLSGAVLGLSDFDLANLSGADLSSSSLRGASLIRANLSGANLSKAELQINTSRLPLGASRDTNLSEADLRGANLSGANLSGANLSGANLSGANLSGANFNGANLTGAIMSNGSRHR